MDLRNSIADIAVASQSEVSYCVLADYVKNMTAVLA